MHWAYGVHERKVHKPVFDLTTTGSNTMLLTYIILDFTGLAGAAIAKD